jgi:hypothetical protein
MRDVWRIAATEDHRSYALVRKPGGELRIQRAKFEFFPPSPRGTGRRTLIHPECGPLRLNA